MWRYSASRSDFTKFSDAFAVPMRLPYVQRPDSTATTSRKPAAETSCVIGAAASSEGGASAVTAPGNGSLPRTQSTATRTTCGVSELSTVFPMEQMSVSAKIQRYGRTNLQTSARFECFK